MADTDQRSRCLHDTERGFDAAFEECDPAVEREARIDGIVREVLAAHTALTDRERNMTEASLIRWVARQAGILAINGGILTQYQQGES